MRVYIKTITSLIVPDGNRTPNLLIAGEMLWPFELRGLRWRAKVTMCTGSWWHVYSDLHATQHILYLLHAFLSPNSSVFIRSSHCPGQPRLAESILGLQSIPWDSQNKCFGGQRWRKTQNHKQKKQMRFLWSNAPSSFTYDLYGLNRVRRFRLKRDIPTDLLLNVNWFFFSAKEIGLLVGVSVNRDSSGLYE